MLPASGVGDGIDVLRGGAVHVRQSAVHAAGFGIDDLAVQQVVNEEAALGQACVRLSQIVHPAHLGAGGVHIVDTVEAQ